MKNTKQHYRSLTVSEFADLSPIWPESIQLGEAMLIARIHPGCNREQGDEKVLVRALVFDHKNGELRRLTVRSNDIVFSGEGPQEWIAQGYACMLRAVLLLPELDLRDRNDAS